MTGKETLPGKREFVETLLNNGTVLLHIDPRKKGVIVPPWLGKQPQLVLQIGYNMVVPIPDLTIDELGVSATLSFNRSAHCCYVPWEAVFAVVGDDGRGISWPEDLPPEIVAEIEREIARAQLSKKPEGSRPEAQSSSEGESAAAEAATAVSRPRKRPVRTPAKPRPVAAVLRDEGEQPRKRLSSVPAPTSQVGRVVTPASSSPNKVRPVSSRPATKGRARTLPPYLRVIK